MAIAASTRRPLAAAARVGGLQHQHARRVELGGAVGEHPLDRLVVGDRLAERLVLLGVRERRVERGLADAERLRRDRDAPAVERPHRDLEAVARSAEQRVGADAHVLQLEIGAAEAADAERVGTRRRA